MTSKEIRAITIGLIAFGPSMLIVLGIFITGICGYVEVVNTLSVVLGITTILGIFVAMIMDIIW